MAGESREGPAWRWSTAPVDRMQDLRSPWGALSARMGLSAVAGPGWTACFCRAFPAFGGMQVHTLHHGETLAAVLPLQRRRSVLAGWVAPVHPHLPVWTCAVDRSVPGIVDEILGHLLRSAPALELDGRRRRGRGR